MTRLFVFMVLAGGCHPADIDLMKLQPKFKAYEASELFPDTRAMRTPVEGTVPRERVIDRGIAGGVTAEGKYLTTIPVPVDNRMMALGRKRFDITCAACHGRIGDGLSVVATKMSLRAPPSLLTERVRVMAPGQVFHIISAGYGLMPPYSAEIPPLERWGVVAYVKALELSQSATLSQAPEGERQRLEGDRK